MMAGLASSRDRSRPLEEMRMSQAHSGETRAAVAHASPAELRLQCGWWGRLLHLEAPAYAIRCKSVICPL